MQMMQLLLMQVGTPKSHLDFLKEIITEFKNAGIRTSVFLDPDTGIGRNMLLKQAQTELNCILKLMQKITPSINSRLYNLITIQQL